MRTRTILAAATLFAASALLGWLTASGRLTMALAQNKSEPPTNGNQLPKPDPEFRGKIAETFKDSTPSFPQPVKAPKGSPNVLIILTDDTGFGMASTFGGPVPTPTLDRLAKNGLRYNQIGRAWGRQGARSG